MTPADVRALLSAGRLSNREADEALGLRDERLVRRLKSGDETPSEEQAGRLIALGAEHLAQQMIRSINLAAGGRVEIAKLRISERAIDVESALSPAVARAVRLAILERLTGAGLTIERSGDA
jgi:hypothetical protein